MFSYWQTRQIIQHIILCSRIDKLDISYNILKYVPVLTNQIDHTAYSIMFPYSQTRQIIQHLQLCSHIGKLDRSYSIFNYVPVLTNQIYHTTSSIMFSYWQTRQIIQHFQLCSRIHKLDRSYSIFNYVPVLTNQIDHITSSICSHIGKLDTHVVHTAPSIMFPYWQTRQIMQHLQLCSRIDKLDRSYNIFNYVPVLANQIDHTTS